jgi:hypothetical protein
MQGATAQALKRDGVALGLAAQSRVVAMRWGTRYLTARVAVTPQLTCQARPSSSRRSDRVWRGAAPRRGVQLSWPKSRLWLRAGVRSAGARASARVSRPQARSHDGSIRLPVVRLGAAGHNEVRHPAANLQRSSTGRCPTHRQKSPRASTACSGAWIAQELQPVAGGHTSSSTGQRPSPERAVVCAGDSRA